MVRDGFPYVEAPPPSSAHSPPPSSFLPLLMQPGELEQLLLQLELLLQPQQLLRQPEQLLRQGLGGQPRHHHHCHRLLQASFKTLACRGLSGGGFCRTWIASLEKKYHFGHKTVLNNSSTPTDQWLTKIVKFIKWFSHSWTGVTHVLVSWLDGPAATDDRLAGGLHRGVPGAHPQGPLGDCHHISRALAHPYPRDHLEDSEVKYSFHPRTVQGQRRIQNIWL